MIAIIASIIFGFSWITCNLISHKEHKENLKKFCTTPGIFLKDDKPIDPRILPECKQFFTTETK